VKYNQTITISRLHILESLFLFGFRETSLLHFDYESIGSNKYNLEYSFKIYLINVRYITFTKLTGSML